MASALNAFMKIGKAKGESKQEPFVDWIELQSGIGRSRPSSWTKGGGAWSESRPRQAEFGAYLGSS